MITYEKLARYIHFSGDQDAWVASQKRELDSLLNGAEWEMIDKAIQRLKLQKRGFANEDYRAETERVLKKTFETNEVIELARGTV